MEFCDYGCIYAKRPKGKGIDYAKSCRSRVPVYCALKKRIVEKNLRCKNYREKERVKNEA